MNNVKKTRVRKKYSMTLHQQNKLNKREEMKLEKVSSLEKIIINIDRTVRENKPDKKKKKTL